MQQERIENLIKERDGNRLANLKGANEGKCGLSTLRFLIDGLLNIPN